MNSFHRFIPFLFLSLFLSGCQTSGTTVITLPNGAEIKAEVADTEKERMEGLMHRESLAEDGGMLFVFEEEQKLSFWMKDTLIPLDIIYIDAERKVVDIKTMQPCPAEVKVCPNYLSQKPALYALELNAGQASAQGISVGDHIELPLSSH